MNFVRKWTKRLALSLPIMAAASSAFALSCARPSIEGAYDGWDRAPERYYVVSGTLTPVAPLPPIPSFGAANQGQTGPIRGVYRIQGEVLGPNYTSPINHIVWVRVGCAGPWCGQFPSAGTSGVMGFKQLPDNTLELGVGACPGSIFNDADGSAKRTVQRCMAQGGCPPSATPRQ